MPDLTPVVCALDLAPESEPALVAAVELAARAEGPLHLVTVRAPDGPDVYRAPRDPEAGTRAVVEVFVDRALGAGACAEIAPRIVVARGTDPAAEIARYAAEVAAGTLVLGTHGRRGLQRFRLGSVAEAAVRRATFPVLVVPNRAPTRTPGPTHPVLVPVDFSAHSARALAVARTLADLYDAPVEALSVVVGLSEAALGVGISTGVGVDVPSTTAPSDEDLRAFADDAGAGAVGVCVVEGDPAAEVVRRADAVDAGAVVMGTHGRSGFARALFGSVTEAALRRLSCPVLAVRAPQPS